MSTATATATATVGVAIVGFGEIGSSLAKVYENANVGYLPHDPYKGVTNDVSQCDYINIAIPFFGPEKFKESLKELNLKPTAVVIVHSTMRLGTINELQSMYPDAIFVSSPVRGVHPRLTEGLYTFEKFVGFSDKYLDNGEARTKVLSHMESIGLKPVPCKADEAELAKVVSTTLYGLNIAAAEDVARMCDSYGLDFDVVYTRWQIGYNEGYTKLGKPNVCRPVLSRIPASENGQKIIGGHCVLPNAVILKTMEPAGATGPLADYILRYSDEKSRVHRSKAEQESTTKRGDNVSSASDVSKHTDNVSNSVKQFAVDHLKAQASTKQAGTGQAGSAQ